MPAALDHRIGHGDRGPRAVRARRRRPSARARSSTGSPGNSDAVCPSGPSPSNVISNSGRAGRGPPRRRRPAACAHSVERRRRACRRSEWGECSPAARAPCAASPRASSDSCSRDDRGGTKRSSPQYQETRCQGKRLAELLRGEQPVERLSASIRRRARRGTGLAPPAPPGVIHSATWCASDSGSGSTSMRPIVLPIAFALSLQPRMKRSIALANPSSL